MNALLETERAIVSEVPGTTRESIEEWLDLDGWPVRLVDTAGLRDTPDAVEAEGVRRAGALISEADIVLRLYDADDAPAPDGAEIAVRTKCDLGGVPEPVAGLRVSAKTGEGIVELKRVLAERVAALSGEKEASLSAAPDGLVAALAAVPPREAFGPGADPVLIGNSLRDLAGTLGRLVGAAYSEDLLDNLFSRFCVGK